MPRTTGTWTTTTTLGESVRAFVPRPLPPAEPPLAEAAFFDLNRTAELALARLAGVSGLVPSVEWLLYSAIRKEALLTSQIEGTQATLTDLFDEEAGLQVANTDDVEEVTNYVGAFRWVQGQLRDPQGLPVSVRLMCEAHRLLLDGVRGAGKQPGELRRSQNWIGGTRPGNAAFVPPPPQDVPDLLQGLERFIHAPDPTLPPLVRIALVHAQFETIHPFLDGNGRLGRLLIALVLHDQGLLGQPLLYLSLFLKRHRSQYYELLDRVRSEGDWESWLDFFLDGVAVTAQGAVETVGQLDRLFHEDAARVQTLVRAAANTLRVHREFCRRPALNHTALVEATRLSFPTVAKAVDRLVALGIVREVTGNRRNRLFVYTRYLSIMDDAAEA